MSSLSRSLPPVVREILDLFEAELAEVCFGDLDAASLRELAGRVSDAEESVEEARARLEAAREGRDALLRDLVTLSQKALAYAQIYAENDAELRARLDGLGEGQPDTRRRRATRRGKKEVADEVEELPFDQVAS